MMRAPPYSSSTSLAVLGACFNITDFARLSEVRKAREQNSVQDLREVQALRGVETTISRDCFGEKSFRRIQLIRYLCKLNGSVLWQDSQRDEVVDSPRIYRGQPNLHVMQMLNTKFNRSVQGGPKRFNDAFNHRCRMAETKHHASGVQACQRQFGTGFFPSLGCSEIDSAKQRCDRANRPYPSGPIATLESQQCAGVRQPDRNGA